MLICFDAAKCSNMVEDMIDSWFDMDPSQVAAIGKPDSESEDSEHKNAPAPSGAVGAAAVENSEAAATLEKECIGGQRLEREGACEGDDETEA